MRPNNSGWQQRPTAPRPSRWRAIRNAHIAAEPLCRSCAKRGLVVAATEVDHIEPLHKGGATDSDNLQSLCTRCHADKTQAESAAAQGKAFKVKPTIGLDGFPI